MATVQITFRNLDASEAAEAQIERRSAELAQLTDRLTAVRATVSAAHRHQGRHGVYQVHIDLTVPGGPIVVNGEQGNDHTHDDLSLAIRDAFDAARRRLQDHLRRLDGKVKAHHGRGEPDVPAAR
jgi:ribosome-associated translation inhibitor RaiA